MYEIDSDFDVIDKQNIFYSNFRKLNPQFRIDSSNVASSSEEIEYFEDFYSNLTPGMHEFLPDDFNFKRADVFSMQQIFADNWEAFCVDPYCSSFASDNAKQQVDKMLKCQDPSHGFALYQCSHCNKLFAVPFSCKSRICNSCAITYQKKLANNINHKLINCKHRHIVFTIPQQLRHYFLDFPQLLNCLFTAAEQSIAYFFHKRAPRKNLVPGSVLVLHTFGRDLKWNPHIHSLVTEGASSNLSNAPANDTWVNITHFDYEFFRKSFRKTLLDNLKTALKDLLVPFEFKKFKALVNFFYKNYKQGFYVRAKPFDGGSSSRAVSYLLRYFNRPPMAQSRILFYDGKFVVFYYQRHEDNMFVIEKIPVFEFIARIIIHLPQKHFKMIRYTGIYSSHKVALFDKLILKVKMSLFSLHKSLLYWANSIEVSFHYDPLLCPFCGSRISFSNIFVVNSS